MRFNIKEMKYQGIFLGILAGFLALVILVSYLTSLGPAVPTADETPENAETQTESTENKTDKVTNKNDKDTNINTNKNDKGNNDSTTDKKDETQMQVEHVHKWVRGSKVDPTCTEGGYTINTCSCGDNKTTDEKAALGHNLGEWKTAPADSDGVVYNVRSCSRCDYNEKQKVENSGGEENPEQTPPADEELKDEVTDGEDKDDEAGEEKDSEQDGENQDSNEDPNGNQDGENQ